MSEKRDRKLFGTDGIRGIANRFPMTTDIAMKVGAATAYWYIKNSGEEPQNIKFIIGKDTRRSSYMIEQALAAGVCSMGVNCYFLGPLPTPATAFLTKSMRASVGFVVSASHNSYDYNGIKIFDQDGFKLPDEVEAQIEKLILDDNLNDLFPVGMKIGRAKRIEDALGRYIVFAKTAFPQHMNLNKIRIVVDCANGAAYRAAPMVFEELGAEVIAISTNPDGKNINDECGATHPRNMQEAVLKYRADIGIALDGDADRLVMCDEKGEYLDGDVILAITALNLLKKGKLKEKTVVTTQMANLGLKKVIEQAGGHMVYTPVGDRYIVEIMRNKDYNLGGEQSGHLIFLDHATTGDGIIAALKMVSIMIESKQPLSELRKCMTPFPQILKNLPVKEKKPFHDNVLIQKEVKKIEDALADNGRLFIRYSGTEPLLRIMIEGEDIATIKAYGDHLLAIFDREING